MFLRLYLLVSVAAVAVEKLFFLNFYMDCKTLFSNRFFLEVRNNNKTLKYLIPWIMTCQHKLLNLPTF